MAQPDNQTRKRKAPPGGETDDLLVPELRKNGVPLPTVTSTMKAVCFATNHPCTILWHTVVNEFSCNFSDYPTWLPEIADHVQSRLQEEGIHHFLISNGRTRCGPRALSDMGGRQDTWHGSWRQATQKEILQKTRARFNGDRGLMRMAHPREGSPSHQPESPTIYIPTTQDDGWGNGVEESKLAVIPVERLIPDNGTSGRDEAAFLQPDGQSLEQTASESDTNVAMERTNTQQIVGQQSHSTVTEPICSPQVEQSNYSTVTLETRAVCFATNHPCTILWRAIVKEFACNLTDYPKWLPCIADHIQARLRDEGVHDWLVCIDSDGKPRRLIQSAVILDDQGVRHDVWRGIWRRATKQERVARTKARFMHDRRRMSGMPLASEGLSSSTSMPSLIPPSFQSDGEKATNEPVAKTIPRSIPGGDESGQCKLMNADMAQVQPESRTEKRETLARETDSSCSPKLAKPMPKLQSMDEVTTATRAVCFGTNHPCTITWRDIVNGFSRNVAHYPQWTAVIAGQVQAHLHQEDIHDYLVCIDSTGALVRPERGPTNLAQSQRRYSWRGTWRQASKTEFCNKTKARFMENRCRGEPHACEVSISSQSPIVQTNPALAQWGVAMTQNEPMAVPVARLMPSSDKYTGTGRLITTDKPKSRGRKASMIQTESFMALSPGGCASQILTSSDGPPCKKIRHESMYLTDDVGPRHDGGPLGSPMTNIASSPVPNSDTASDECSTSVGDDYHLTDSIQDPMVPTEVPAQYENRMLRVASRHRSGLSPLNCITINDSLDPHVMFHPEDDDDAKFGIMAIQRDAPGQSPAESDHSLRYEGCESRPIQHQRFETAANRRAESILTMPLLPNTPVRNQPSASSPPVVRRTQPSSYFNAEILQRSRQSDRVSEQSSWQEQGVAQPTHSGETGFSKADEQPSDTTGTQSNLLNFPAPDVNVGYNINPTGPMSTKHNKCSEHVSSPTEFRGTTCERTTQPNRNSQSAQSPEDECCFSTTSRSPYSGLSKATYPFVLDDNVMHQTSCQRQAPAKSSVPFSDDSKCTDSIRATPCSSCGELCGNRAPDNMLVSILVLIILLQTALLVMAGMCITARTSM